MADFVNLIWPFGSLFLAFLYSLIGINLSRIIFSNSRFLSITMSSSLGVAILIITAYITSKLGFRFENIGLVLIIVILLGLAAIAYNFDFRLIKDLLLLNSLVFVSTFPYIWPFFIYGKQWIAYANDDMSNYVLGASRLYYNGFYDLPFSASLVNGLDYSQAYYWFHAKELTRPGSELFLSLISIFNHGDQLGFYMIVVVSLQIILISTMLGYLSHLKKKKISIFLTLGLCSLLPLFGVSLIFQLIGQIGGQALALAFGLALYWILKKENLKYGDFIVLSVYFIGTLIWYPEIIPFTGIPILLYLIYILYSKKLRISNVVKLFVFSQAVAFILLQSYYAGAFRFLIRQLSGTQIDSSANNTELFPYFLVPKGLSGVFGWTPMSISHNALSENFFIALSIAILCFLIYPHRFIRRNSFFLYLTFCTNLAALGYLIFTDSGFGSFKAALFLQPSLILILAVHLTVIFSKISERVHFQPKSIIYLVPLCLVTAAPIFGTQQYYVRGSKGAEGQSYSQLQGASPEKLIYETRQLVSRVNKADTTIVITHNIVLGKILAYSFRNRQLFFESDDFFRNFYRPEYRKEKSPLYFKEYELGSKFFMNTVSVPNYQLDSNVNVLVAESERTIVGGSEHFSPRKSSSWSFILGKPQQNLIFFKPSKLGGAYYSPERRSIGLFQAEADPMVLGGTIQAMGRNVLFQILNPVEDSQLILEISSSFLPQHKYRLPVTNLIGSNSQELDLVGRGSARVLSEKVSPVEVAGRNFLQLNYETNPRVFPSKKVGLMNLYNGDVPFDSRLISVFGRRIDLIRTNTPSIPPAKISNFRKDFLNSNLFYSGIYEDGWLSEEAYVYLAKPKGELVLRGNIPSLGNKNFRTNLSISIQGEPAIQRQFEAGSFKVSIPVSKKWAKMPSLKVGFKFSNTQILPRPDGRVVAAFLEAIG